MIFENRPTFNMTGMEDGDYEESVSACGEIWGRDCMLTLLISECDWCCLVSVDMTAELVC